MLAEHGAKVVVNDLGGDMDGSGTPTTGPALDVVNEIKAMGGEAVANGDDISSWDGAQRLINTAIETFGGLDVLINNAGISRDRPYQPGDVPVEAIREVYETNVIGVIAVTNTMLPLLRRSAAGYIGNVSSGLGTIALLTDYDSDWARYANLLGYNSSKAALNAVTLIYARSLAADGIRVNALSPGFVATDLNRHTGHLPAAQGGANIAEQILRDGTATGQFLSETGGTHPW